MKRLGLGFHQRRDGYRVLTCRSISLWPSRYRRPHPFPMMSHASVQEAAPQFGFPGQAQPVSNAHVARSRYGSDLWHAEASKQRRHGSRATWALWKSWSLPYPHCTRGSPGVKRNVMRNPSFSFALQDGPGCARITSGLLPRYARARKRLHGAFSRPSGASTVDMPVFGGYNYPFRYHVPERRWV